MSSYTVLDHGNKNARSFDSRKEADEKAKGVKSMVNDSTQIEVVKGEYEEYADYEAAKTDGGIQEDTTETSDAGTGYIPTRLQPDDEDSINALAENPIDWLAGKNSAYVNTIQGTDAISKRGFRYIQSRFGISTRSEIVKWVDDPLGVVIWARAELPDGRYAEAHGEGYQFESGVDDNEFVRYCDTRAKNRALADLTSSGALASEEMEGGSN